MFFGQKIKNHLKVNPLYFEGSFAQAEILKEFSTQSISTKNLVSI